MKDIGEGEEILANYIDSWEGSFLDHAQRQVNSLPFQSNVYRIRWGFDPGTTYIASPEDTTQKNLI